MFISSKNKIQSEQSDKSNANNWKFLEQSIRKYFIEKKSLKLVSLLPNYCFNYDLELKSKKTIQINMQIYQKSSVTISCKFSIKNYRDFSEAAYQQNLVKFQQLSMSLIHPIKIVLHKQSYQVEIISLIKYDDDSAICQDYFQILCSKIDETAIKIVQNILQIQMSSTNRQILKQKSITNTLRRVIEREIDSRKKSHKFKQQKKLIGEACPFLDFNYDNAPRIKINKAENQMKKLCEMPKKIEESILQVIKLHDILEEQQVWSHRKTNYSQIRQIYGNFDVIKTSTNKQAHKLLESQQKIEKTLQNRTGFLIEKKPINTLQSLKSFDNQLQILNIIRNFSCNSLARYYIESQKLQKALYLQKYQSQLNLPSLSLKRGLLTCVLISIGIAFFHQHKIVHRDLKPNNIMIDVKNQLQPKIIDLGSSCPAITRNYNIKLPQFLETTKYYNLLYYELPQGLKNYIQIEEYERNQNFDVYAFGKIMEIYLRPEITETKNQSLKFLIQNLIWTKNKCLEMNPYDRINPTHLFGFLKNLWGMLKQIQKNH